MDLLLSLYDFLMPWYIFILIVIFLISILIDIGAILERLKYGTPMFVDKSVEFTERKKQEGDERVPDPAEEFWGGVREINRQRGGWNSWGRR